MALECKKIYHSYGDTLILENIDMSVEDSEFLCIVGPSGCGKSTLLRILAGIFQPSSGSILLDGHQLSPKEGHIGFVFQEDAVFPWLTVAQNIEFALKARGIESLRRKQLTREALAKVNLESYLEYYPKQLSGGMKQRVAIARVLAYNPRLLLMDEPFASLDAINRNHLQKELIQLWQREQKTVIFVTHNIDEAVFLADRVLVMGKNPGDVKKIVKIDLTRPRERTDEGFCRCRRQILELL